MVYPDSAMARRDPGLDKENLVPRAHKSEPGSGGLGSVRTSEQRLLTVLKESALQNQVSLLCCTLGCVFAAKGFIYTRL